VSHFYSSIQGGRGEATRCGDKHSGIQGHIRGWRSGVQVWGEVSQEGEDRFTISVTNGSHSTHSRYVGDVVIVNGVAVFRHNNTACALTQRGCTQYSPAYDGQIESWNPVEA